MLEANESLLCFESATGVMKRYDAYLATHKLEAEDSKLLCDAARFRIAGEVLSEVAKFKVRPLKPK